MNGGTSYEDADNDEYQIVCVNVDLSMENCLEIFSAASDSGRIDLQKQALKFILKNASELLRSNKILDLLSLNLAKLFACDELACSECEVFSAAIRWVTNICKDPNDADRPPSINHIRKVFQPFVPFIRFPLMSAQEVEEIVAPTGVLTEIQLETLRNYLQAPENQKPKISGFSTRPRTATAVNVISFNSEAVTEEEEEEEETFNQWTPPVIISSVTQSTNASPSAVVPNQNGTGSPFSDCSGSVSSGFSGATKRIRGLKSVSGTKRFRGSKSIVISDTNKTNGGDGGPRVVTIAESERTSASSVPLIVQIKDQQNDTDASQEVQEHCLIIDLEIVRKDTFKRFANFFDIRKYVAFRKQTGNWEDWKIKEMWGLSLTTPISIKVNGTTFLKINQAAKELTISIGYDSKKVFKGLEAKDDLRKLSLAKTNFPIEEVPTFPTKLLEEVVLYNIWAIDEMSLAKFTKRCPNLTSLSVLLIIPEVKPVLNCVKLHLTDDLVSGDKLKCMTLFKTKLMFTQGTVKAGITELCLEFCCWTPAFAANIHLVFPNLKRFTCREEPSRMAVRETDRTIYMSTFPLRIFLNLLKIKSVEYIRIWGMAWQYFAKYPATPNHNGKWVTSKPHANLHETQADLERVENFLELCGLSSRAINFEIKKDKNKWEGKEFDDTESDKVEDGFWDFTKQLDFNNFRLHNIFENYQTFKKCFSNEYYC